jgi:hypothetical protein
MQWKVRNVGMECKWKALNKAIPTVPPEGQTEERKALKPRAKAALAPNCAQRSKDSIWESGWEVGVASQSLAYAYSDARKVISGSSSRIFTLCSKQCKHGQLL